MDQPEISVSPHASPGSGPADPDGTSPQLAAGPVIDFIGHMVKAIRGTQTYSANNPVYVRLLGNFRAATEALWQQASALHLSVEEGGLRWEDKLFPSGQGRDTLSFLFFRDGIRQLTFLPGFEDELDRFISLILKARSVSRDGDDLVTLLWTEEFTGFRYAFVDLLADVGELPAGSGGGDHQLTGVSAAALREEVESGAAELVDSTTSPAAGAASDLAALLARDEHEQTLYFLSEHERRTLESEIEAEWTRDLRGAVLTALFDRLEDSPPARQAEILAILDQLLPVLLGRGDVASTTTIVRELRTISAAPGFPATLAAQVEQWLDRLSDEEVLSQLVRLLEDGVIGPDAGELQVYFAELRASALPVLIRAVEGSRVDGVRRRLQAALDGLAARHEASLLPLLESREASVQLGAIRAAARLQLASAAPVLGKLLERDVPELRRTVVEAMVRMPPESSAPFLRQLLEDEDREIRMGAARALGELRYQPARAAFEALIEGRALRELDLTEKITIFESYGGLAGAEGVPLLDRILNGKGLLGRRPSSDHRACAALALGVIALPAARASLEKAAADGDPVVRSAVGRALRREVQGT